MKSIYHYDDFRVFLQDFYLDKKMANSHFSHRLIEQKCGLNNGHFSRIIKGSTNLTDKSIIKFLKLLNLSSTESQYFQNLVKYCQAKDIQIRTEYYNRLIELRPPDIFPLQKEHIEFFKEPHHVILHALVNIINISSTGNMSAIGKLFLPPLSEEQVKQSLALLEKLELIVLDNKKVYRITHNMLSLTSYPKDILLRRFFQNSLTHAGFAYDTVPFENRVMSCMTVSLSEDSYKQLTDLLAETRQKVNRIIKNEKKADKIYQLSLHLVPVSRKLTSS